MRIMARKVILKSLSEAAYKKDSLAAGSFWFLNNNYTRFATRLKHVSTL
jgi:hypothetical protein